MATIEPHVEQVEHGCPLDFTWIHSLWWKLSARKASCCWLTTGFKSIGKRCDCFPSCSLSVITYILTESINGISLLGQQIRQKSERSPIQQEHACMLINRTPVAVASTAAEP
ncbi:hypothetical protein BDA96_05G006700 [Sorghum bicolor]|nr:hypothetical protein BDA96_05G006700 [Sorghum bicolor]